MKPTFACRDQEIAYLRARLKANAKAHRAAMAKLRKERDEARALARQK